MKLDVFCGRGYGLVLGFVLGKISAILGELGALDFKNGEVYGQKYWKDDLEANLANLGPYWR